MKMWTLCLFSTEMIAIVMAVIAFLSGRFKFEALRYHVNASINVDLSLDVFCDIRLKAI